MSGQASFVVKQILRELNTDSSMTYWTMREGRDRLMVEDFAEKPRAGVFIIDDFHRLEERFQQRIANLVKAAAESEEPERFPKVIVVGINKVGSTLIQQVHDIGKRLGIHRIKPGSKALVMELLQKGEKELLVDFQNKGLFRDFRGIFHWRKWDPSACGPILARAGTARRQPGRQGRPRAWSSRRASTGLVSTKTP